MTTEHSKGPWRYDYEPGYCGELIAADGTTICTFSDEPNSKDAMVMSVAPELLDACIAMTEWDDREKDHAVDFYARMELCRIAFDKVRAAISKARGSQ